METEQFIETVRKYPCVRDVEATVYRDNELKGEIWERIAVKHGIRNALKADESQIHRLAAKVPVAAIQKTSDFAWTPEYRRDSVIHSSNGATAIAAIPFREGTIQWIQSQKRLDVGPRINFQNNNKNLGDNEVISELVRNERVKFT
ncbi:hypothetical protein WH47_12066 [Habropoda laboriosa]|uniref:MADF domain-containing protein n=1 Tax=Habropoda laboriosa TaxID=597456 RepID=A0A0L7R184_9HYME|nr:hypothetical protein WH47_12066 [Habropoda laboriosa]